MKTGVAISIPADAAVTANSVHAKATRQITVLHVTASPCFGGVERQMLGKPGDEFATGADPFSPPSLRKGDAGTSSRQPPNKAGRRTPCGTIRRD